MGFFKKLFGKKTDDFYAPMTGKAVPITEVPDPTFAEGMLGNGIAIEPADGKVYAPCDATVDMMFSTGHAVSLTTDNGVEMLREFELRRHHCMLWFTHPELYGTASGMSGASFICRAGFLSGS